MYVFLYIFSIFSIVNYEYKIIWNKIFLVLNPFCINIKQYHIVIIRLPDVWRVRVGKGEKDRKTMQGGPPLPSQSHSLIGQIILNGDMNLD